ncbi:MAG: hypothetical protein IT292_08030 [Deltaproteobacteria bacterium]|nr:hypothetical protein [Deltaproteobacteria bacterium]
MSLFDNLITEDKPQRNIDLSSSPRNIGRYLLTPLLFLVCLVVLLQDFMRAEYLQSKANDCLRSGDYAGYWRQLDKVQQIAPISKGLSSYYLAQGLKCLAASQPAEALSMVMKVKEVDPSLDAANKFLEMLNNSELTNSDLAAAITKQIAELKKPEVEWLIENISGP